MAVPLVLGDLESNRIKFEAGDRILVLTVDRLGPSNIRRIEEAVSRFAKEDVRVAIVNCTDLILLKVERDETTTKLCGPEMGDVFSRNEGTVSINCAKIVFKKGDRLLISPLNAVSVLQKKRWVEYFKRWVGDDVEVVFLGSVY